MRGATEKCCDSAISICSGMQKAVDSDLFCFVFPPRELSCALACSAHRKGAQVEFFGGRTSWVNPSHLLGVVWYGN